MTRHMMKDVWTVRYGGYVMSREEILAELKEAVEGWSSDDCIECGYALQELCEGILSSNGVAYVIQ